VWKGTDRGKPKGTDRGKPKGTDRGKPKGTDRGKPKGTDRGNRRVLTGGNRRVLTGGETCHSASLSTTNLTRTRLELHCGIRDGRPAIYRLSYGTAF
jgi:hypothetical protein